MKRRGFLALLGAIFVGPKVVKAEPKKLNTFAWGVKPLDLGAWYQKTAEEMRADLEGYKIRSLKWRAQYPDIG